MTQQQFIEEVKRLSVAERVALLEVISRSVREDFEAHGEVFGAPTPESEQTAHGCPDQNKVTISQRLYGVIKFDGDPPTDEEVKDIYADYLTEKYS